MEWIGIGILIAFGLYIAPVILTGIFFVIIVIGNIIAETFNVFTGNKKR